MACEIQAVPRERRTTASAPVATKLDVVPWVQSQSGGVTDAGRFQEQHGKSRSVSTDEPADGWPDAADGATARADGADGGDAAASPPASGDLEDRADRRIGGA